MLSELTVIECTLISDRMMSECALMLTESMVNECALMLSGLTVNESALISDRMMSVH